MWCYPLEKYPIINHAFPDAPHGHAVTIVFSKIRHKPDYVSDSYFQFPVV